MKYFCLFAAFGFWISIVIKDVFYVCLFIMVFSLFLMYRFKRKLIVIIWALFTVCFVVYINKPIEEPQPGQYMIYEIKPKYCLARKDNVSIIVYGIEDPEYYDVYKISEFEKVNTIKNIGQFVFEEYLHKQSIYYSANVSRYMYVKTENSIKNDVYNHLKNRKYANFYLSNFYGIRNEDVSTILINLGLPILGVISILRKFLLRIFSKNNTILTDNLVWKYFCFYTKFGSNHFVSFRKDRLFKMGIPIKLFNNIIFDDLTRFCYRVYLFIPGLRNVSLSILP